MKTNRRIILKAVAAACLTPASAVMARADDQTPIAALWNEVEACECALIPHQSAITEAEALRGVSSGWMYLADDGYQAGQRRYDALVSILKETPRTENDLMIMAKASRSRDITNGPLGWASQRLAQSVINYHMAA